MADFTNEEIKERLEGVQHYFGQIEEQLRLLVLDVEKNSGTFTFGGFKTKSEFIVAVKQIKSAISDHKSDIVTWINKSF